MSADRMRTIKAVEARGGARLHLRWSDGTEADVPLSPDVLPLPSALKPSRP